MSSGAPRGRPARSAYTVVEALDGAALLRVRIHTGRTHQIRAHLAAIGHPVAVGEPATPITLKIPANVVRELRAYSAASGVTQGEIVARALTAFLAAAHKHG